MKGKNRFTSEEFEQIKQLVKEKGEASSNKQKTIRDRIRKLGFYYSDFSDKKDGYTVFDLEMFVKSKKITITDGIDNQLEWKGNNAEIRKEIITDNLAQLLEAFKQNRFDPTIDQEALIPNRPGNYIICLRSRAKLPLTPISPSIKFFDGLKVIYTGISQNSLRMRDYKQHFKGDNAGRSTLRKSLGVLLGYRQIPRDKGVVNRKTKFNEIDEQQLTQWMCNNLIIYFLSTEECNIIEDKLIGHFNPPLNLKGNSNSVNFEFRKQLSNLRNKRD